MPDYMIKVFYFISVLFIILGFKKITAKETIGQGVIWAGAGILIAVIVTFFHQNLNANYVLITIAILLGGGVAFIFSNQVTLSNTSKMTALFGGMGGGAVALIMALELMKLDSMSDNVRSVAVASAFIGSISFAACLTVFAKYQGLLSNQTTFSMQQWINALVLVVTVTFGVAIIINGNHFELSSLILFILFALLSGVLVTLPVQYSDLSMLVSLFISLTALAIGLGGYVFNILPMLVVGVLVASASIAMTMRMAKVSNRSLTSVLFASTNVGSHQSASLSDLDDFDFFDDEVPNVLNETTTSDLATMLAYANKVIIVPGYGMAVSQAQERLWELTKLLTNKGVNVKFAIHPVAGRMSGHMNVLLAETGLTYDSLFDLDEINDEFVRTDVVLVVGANDTVNPRARNDQSSSLFGLSILNADKARNVVVIKRGNGLGYSQNENPLFEMENTKMLYGNADSVLASVLSEIKTI